MSSTRTVLSLLLFLFVIPGFESFAQQRQESQSAWGAFIQENPAAVEDSRIGWKDRLILDVLNPQQAQEYYNGASVESIRLENGQSLQQYLDKRLAPEGNLFFPLSAPCTLFRLDDYFTEEPMVLMARGDDLSQQGGSPSGCGIPSDASALMIQMRVESSAGIPIQVKLWALDNPEPSESLMVSAREQSDSTMVVVPLNQPSDSAEGDIQISSSDWSAVDGQVVGYFRRQHNGAFLEGGVSFYEESNSFNQNDFFGFQAGGKNTWGVHNAFFGKVSGYSNTTGNHNAFFGAWSGYSNTSGAQNAFYGFEAGKQNTTGYQNSFFGTVSGTRNTTGRENAFFGFAAGYHNTTGKQNAAFGWGAGSETKTGYSNAFFGYKAGFNTTTSENAYFGSLSGFSNTTGIFNAFFGSRSGYSNTTGRENSFFGRDSGYYNTTGSNNAIFGFGAGYRNTAGSHNAFFGWGNGTLNTTGHSNSFFGSEAGYSNTTGLYNSFFGRQSGHINTTGKENAFFGSGSGSSNTTGSYNAFFGYRAGFNNSTAESNAFFGFAAGFNNNVGFSNVFIGKLAGHSNTVERFNTMIGDGANLKADPVNSPVENATAIGYRAYVAKANSLILGSIAGLNGATNNVNVGIGTAAPSVPLHIARSDGTAQLLVREDSTVPKHRNLFELNNLGPVQFHMINRRSGVDWTFRNNWRREFTIQTDPVTIIQFALNEEGDLTITGDLIAKAVLYSSDRNKKENFSAVDPQQTLKKLAAIPITEWNFKTDPTRHIGPMAQDFFAAFGVGEDSMHLNPTDTAGVTMAAIQGLYQQNVELKADLQARDAQLELLRKELEKLQSKVEELGTLKSEWAEIRHLLYSSSKLE